jgi:hypothetical protein
MLMAVCMAFISQWAFLPSGRLYVNGCFYPVGIFKLMAVCIYDWGVFRLRLWAF